MERALANEGAPAHGAGTMLLALNESFLWASLVWGAVGTAYFVYGTRQKEPWPFAGGLVMIGSSYLIDAWWLMSLVSIAVIFGVRWLMRRDFI